MKQTYKKLIVCMALLVTPLALPLTVSAHEHEESGTVAQVPPEKKTETQRQEAKSDEYYRALEAQKAKIAERELKNDEIRQKLDDAKRKVCEKHQKNINNLMTRVISAREKQVAHIDEIANRVQTYYEKNELTVENYDALVADVEEKHAIAAAALASAKPETPFTCDGTGPKAELQEFRGKRDAAVEAIREYRASVKNLIKAVKEAKKATNEESNNG